MATIMGSETEFGLVLEGGTHTDTYRFLLCLSRRLKEGHPVDEQAGFLGKIAKRINWWGEDLSLDEGVDAAHGEPDVLRRLGGSGEYLRNGSRFYIDGSHPEYSTPECRDPWELVAHERGGEIIVHALLKKIGEELGVRVHLLKRNADYRGHSYACHPNYLTSRRIFQLLSSPGCTYSGLPLNWWQGIWAAHLISMQIFSGAGRILPGLDWPECFALSQRQHFIRYFSAPDTTNSRSIINTRDRPYADPERFGRLHVICCDSNRADWSNILKYGTSALILGALEDFSPTGTREYLFPVNSVAEFAKVQNARTLVSTVRGSVSALEMQRLLLDFVSRWHAAQNRPEYFWAPRLFEIWGCVLDLLESGDDRLYSLLDFFVKKRLFEESWERGRSLKKLKSLEHNYHLVSPESLFGRLLKEGQVETLVSDESIGNALVHPPNTRAKLRSRLLRFVGGHKFRSWHILFLRNKKEDIEISMPNPASPSERSVLRETTPLLRRILGKFEEGGAKW